MKIVNLCLLSNICMVFGLVTFVIGAVVIMTLFFLVSLICTLEIAKELLILDKNRRDYYDEINLLEGGD